MTSFCEHLAETIRVAHFSANVESWDIYRQGPEPVDNSLRKQLSRALFGWLRSLQLHRSTHLALINPQAFADWAPLFGRLNWLHGTLADKQSRELLVKLVAHRIMDGRCIRLPRDTPAYWQELSEIDRFEMTGIDQVETDIPGPAPVWHDLSSLGLSLKICTRPAAVFNQFILQAYRCQRALVDASPGDVVIDAGGCWGDTALLFADKVGAEGKVFSFEFMPENLAIFRENLNANPSQGARVSVVENAVWSESGKPMSVSSGGPGTIVRPASESSEDSATTTITIDDFVLDQKLERLDLIKMDIEGAEFDALKGASDAIRRFRPNLAICVYHSPDDFVRLAEQIDLLGLGYSYHLDHFTTIDRETVLFCTCR
jgi:FkbM family methyltransferase